MKIFDRSNLFSHINGAAEFYFSYGFQKVFVVLYVKGDAEITLEIYDHGDIENAYGIYSMERPPMVVVRDIGAEGYYEEKTLNFVTGSYYVKMRAYRLPDGGYGILKSTAYDLCSLLGGGNKLPAIIEAMPETGLVRNSRQYVSNNFMGLEFLGSAYSASYHAGEAVLVMFVIERSTSEDIDSLIANYYDFAKGVPAVQDDENYRIEDPFNGTIYLNKAGKYIIGFSGADQSNLRDDLLGKMMVALNEID